MRHSSPSVTPTGSPVPQSLETQAEAVPVVLLTHLCGALGASDFGHANCLAGNGELRVRLEDGAILSQLDRLLELHICKTWLRAHLVQNKVCAAVCALRQERAALALRSRCSRRQGGSIYWITGGACGCFLAPLWSKQQVKGCKHCDGADTRQAVHLTECPAKYACLHFFGCAGARVTGKAASERCAPLQGRRRTPCRR